MAVIAGFGVPDAAEAVDGRCTNGAGVTVVVDPGPLGDDVRVRCAPPGFGALAVEAAHAAGFEITYADGQPFVCRVDGRPGPDQESCARTPPSDAYWGLFWSDGRSPEWSYSPLGIASLKISSGGSVGLRFQDGGEREEPSLAPTTEDTDGSTPAEDPEPTPAPGSPSEPSDPDAEDPLPWAAGAALLALTATALVVAWRRRA